MTMKKLLTLALCGLGAVSLTAAELRTWTDRNGKQIQAELAGVKDGKVALKLANGGVASVPLTILSEKDQQFVRAQAGSVKPAAAAPQDPASASVTIDSMVMNKLKASYQAIVQDLDKTKRTPVSDTFTVQDKIKKVEELEYLKKMTYEQLDDPLSDEQFVRRVYLDIGGRIPTYQETKTFLAERNPNKRAKLIDDLLASEAFVSHFFNYMSDLLRIREGIGMNGLNGLQAGAYVDWTKDQIRKNRHWNEWVTELLSAEGFYWDNPATGYLLTDQGMELCNLSNTFTVFTGSEITCAQCHDHPFEEIYQMDFYKLAAFFGGTELRGGNRTPEGSAANQKRRTLESEWNQRNAGKTPLPRFPQQLRDVMGAFQYYAADSAPAVVKLPHDYKYDDAKPFAEVHPAPYFGEEVNLKAHGTPRKAFAAWLTSKDNPRFTVNTVNRLWRFAFGLAQIEPVYNIPGHLDGQAQNYELLKYLEQLMKDMDYDLKGFLRVLYNTKTYQREANRVSPTMAQVDQGEYHFPAPVLRRMSAEQMWDSLVALSTDQPESAQTRILEQYQSLMRSDWSTVNLDQALSMANRINSLATVQMSGMQEMDGMQEKGKKLTRDMREPANMQSAAAPDGRVDDLLIRASERKLPDTRNLLLASFGQSDKQIIEGGHQTGSIPQVMFLLNGELTNKLMSRDSSAIVQHARSAKAQSEGVEIVYLSVLSRRPKPEEARMAVKLVEGDDYSDLVWALLNSREFMFIQ